MPRLVLPIGKWTPDPPTHGIGDLDVCENLIPIAGGLQSIPAPLEAASIYDRTRYLDLQSVYSDEYADIEGNSGTYGEAGAGYFTSPSVPASGSFTVAFWYRRGSIQSAQVSAVPPTEYVEIIACHGNDAVTPGAYNWAVTVSKGLSAMSLQVYLSMFDAATLGWSYGGAHWDIDRWSHLCFTYDGTASRFKMYLDGDLVSNKPMVFPSPTPTAAPIRIGANPAYVSGPSPLSYNGMLDDFRYYNTVLTDAQVKLAMEFAMTVADPQPVAWYTFEGLPATVALSTGDAAEDNSGSYDAVFTSLTSVSGGDGAYYRTRDILSRYKYRLSDSYNSGYEHLLSAQPVTESARYSGDISRQLYYDRPQLFFGSSFTMQRWDEPDDGSRLPFTEEVSPLPASGRAEPSYATGASAPSRWSFVGWGDDVIATNYADPVQYIQPGDSYFSDLITEDNEWWLLSPTFTAVPRAKFVTVLGAHAVLLNIALDADFPPAPDANPWSPQLPAGAYPQHVWWSATENPAIYASESTQRALNTGFNELLDIPGEITGIANILNDAVLIFKRRGIHIMARTGGSDIYTFQVLHTGITAGTTFPASIVSVGKDVYYWNTVGDIVMLEGLNAPRSIAEGNIVRRLMDRKGHVDAFSMNLGKVTADQEHVVGVLDGSQEHIYWFYKGYGDSSGLRRGVVYNVRQGTFSAINLNDTDIDGIASMITRQPHNALHSYVGDEDIPFAIQAIDRRGKVYRFNSTDFLDWRVKTKAMSLVPDQPAEMTVGKGDVALSAIRPIMKSSPEDYKKNMCKIIIEASDSPDMQNASTYTLDPYSGGYLPSNDGTYRVPGGKIIGSYFTFELSMPGESSNRVIELFGIEVEYSVAGRKGID